MDLINIDSRLMPGSLQRDYCPMDSFIVPANLIFRKTNPSLDNKFLIFVTSVDLPPYNVVTSRLLYNVRLSVFTIQIAGNHFFASNERTQRHSFFFSQKRSLQKPLTKTSIERLRHYSVHFFDCTFISFIYL